MWNDIRIWDDTLVWTDLESIGAVLPETRVVYPVVTPDITGMLSERQRVTEMRTAIDSFTVDDNYVHTIGAGFMIEQIVFNNTVPNVGQISIGLTGDDGLIMESMAFAQGLTVVPINKVLSLTTATDIYFNESVDDDSWNGMTADVYLLLKKIT